jgi:hypothetical protein
MIVKQLTNVVFGKSTKKKLSGDRIVEELQEAGNGFSVREALTLNQTVIAGCARPPIQPRQPSAA